MKSKLTYISIFFITLILGYFSYSAFIKAVELKNNIVSALEYEVSAPPATELPLAWEDEPAAVWMIEEAPSLKIKLQEPGEGFHGDQVIARTDETWLGFYEKNNRYYLRYTKVRVPWDYDVVLDEEGGKKTGKSVFVENNADALFLVKGAKNLSEGEIPTIFYGGIRYRENEPPEIFLEGGSNYSFEFNGESYSLRVENKLASDKYPSRGSKLILEHNGKEQVLRYLMYGCDDCSWHLHWVGDLDRDGKLDFYFDLTDHYNVMDKRLFLSSYAEEDELVKFVADFWTNGC